MKKASLFIKSIIYSLLLVLVFSANLLAQETHKTENKRKIRYIPSKTTPTQHIPKIRIIKRGVFGENPSRELNKVKPPNFDLEKKAFKLINEKRLLSGLKPLIWNDKVANLARNHSQNMAKHRFFSHIGLNGRSIDQRALDFGLDKWESIGENIAYNKGFKFPAQFAVERWMLSSTHRENLLNRRWKESGIGLCITEDGIYFFTQIFIVE